MSEISMTDRNDTFRLSRTNAPTNMAMADGLSSTLSPTNILDTGSGRLDGSGAYRKPAGGPVPNQGAVYLVLGCSGATANGALDHPVMFTSMKKLGSLVLDIDGNRLDAKFLRETGATNDYFTIVKGPVQPVEPPPAPTGLVATPGNAQVFLNWNTSKGATSYSMRRAEVSGGPYSVLTGGITATSYTDRTVSNGVTYYYVVKAVNSA